MMWPASHDRVGRCERIALLTPEPIKHNGLHQGARADGQIFPGGGRRRKWLPPRCNAGHCAGLPGNNQSLFRPIEIVIHRIAGLARGVQERADKDWYNGFCTLSGPRIP
jgi:hypothetical protein